MQIGFVNFNTEEKKKVAKMMQLLQEQEAIEELGIGRVRDHFSNTLFPGTSTLQHRAKYFAILPSLYYYLSHCGRRYNSSKEVRQAIIQAEIQITRQLAECETTPVKTGITGIDTYKAALGDYRKFVKYDPSYIYGGGMATFEMIPSTSTESLIFEISRRNNENPHNKRNYTEDHTEDSDDLNGDTQLIETSGEKYNFTKDGSPMPLSLTYTEADFIKGKILTSEASRDSLLAYLIKSPNIKLSEQITYYDLRDLMPDLDDINRDIYNKSVLFSKLVHIIDWGYNHAYYRSFGNIEEADKCESAIRQLVNDYQDALNDTAVYEALYDYIVIRVNDYGTKEFCKSCYDAIMKNDLPRLDQLITSRERSIKHVRSKIGNANYNNQKRGNPSPNTFRWANVRTMVMEIRNPQ